MGIPTAAIVQAPSMTAGVSIENASVFFNRDGTITGKAKYGCRKDGGMSLTIGQEHPFDGNAYLAQFGYEWDVSGFIFADCDYAGIWSSTVYMVDGIAATQQQPIETNPAFTGTLGGYPFPVAGWTLTGGGYPFMLTGPSALNGAIYDPNSGDFQCFPASAPNGLGGVTSYLAAGFSLRITNGTMDSSEVTDAIELLATSTSSVTAGLITYSYDYPAFLYTNVTYKEVPLGIAGGVWTLTVELTWTPPNGWNSLIYA